MTRLEIHGPGNRRNNFELSQSDVSIGRDAKNDVVLDDLRVSRHHAVIRETPEGLTIRDLASGNGTLVNGQPLSANFDLQIDDSDVIKVGNCSIIIHRDKPITPSAEFRQMLQRTPGDLLTSSIASAESSQEVSPSILRRQLEKAERLLRLFHELGEKLGSIFSLDEIFGKVFDIIMQSTPASRSIIFRKNEQGEFEEVASRTRDEDEASRPLPISKTIFEKVARERVSVMLTDAQTANQALSSHSIIAHQIRSVMAAPIIGPRGLLGIVYADYYDLTETFSAQDLDVLNAVAVQTGIAINTVINHERLQRQAEARARFERFLPRQVVDEILRSPEKIKLGGVRQKVTALFADVRNFTSLSEESSPELIVSLLNKYFTTVSEVIFRHGGTLDKYIGDGLMALFGAPYASELDAIQAVRAAIEMQRAMVTFNQQLSAEGLPAISIGIGVNTGTAIVGYIGSESRLDYTAIGDTINTAARVESIAKSGQIIITENTVQVLDESVQVRQLGTEKLKGKNVNLRFYEVVWR